MNRFDKQRIVAGAIALIFFAIAYVILSVLVIEASKADDVLSEPKVWTGPPIPKCDKELWLRITEGCK